VTKDEFPANSTTARRTGGGLLYVPPGVGRAWKGSISYANLPAGCYMPGG
jgi:hypothetical protein